MDLCKIEQYQTAKYIQGLIAPVFSNWLKDAEGSRRHLLRCTAAHFKNMRMVFDTTFCGDFPASSVQPFKHALKRMNMLLIIEDIAYHFRT